MPITPQDVTAVPLETGVRPPTADEAWFAAWPQTAGELNGYANYLERRGAAITADQLRLALRLAQSYVDQQQWIYSVNLLQRYQSIEIIDNAGSPQAILVRYQHAPVPGEPPPEVQQETFCWPELQGMSDATLRKWLGEEFGIRPLDIDKIKVLRQPEVIP